MVSVMLYPCILCGAPLMDLFLLCVFVFDNVFKFLGEQFRICLAVLVILLLNVMDVFSVGGGLEVLCWIDPVWSSKECPCCLCDPSVYLSVPSIGFVYVFVGWK